MVVTKKMQVTILELKEIVKKYGYWSKEVYNYNNRILGKYNNNQYTFIQGSVTK